MAWTTPAARDVFNAGGSKRPSDARIGELAGRQGGHVTSSQLIGLGLSRREIACRAELGRLIRVHQGVYAVGHPPTNPIDRAKGAVLACGPRTALAFSAAAAYWGVFKRWSHPLELVTAGDRRPKGLRVHKSKTLLRRDIRTIDGLRITSPARTLLDIAPRLQEKQLTGAVDDLRHARRLTINQLKDVVARNPRHPGTKRLTKVIGESQKEPTRSELERAFLRLVKRHRLLTPEINVEVAGYTVDAYYREQQLIVELDGWLTHQTRRAFSRDRRQDMEILAKTGIPTVRLPYDQTTIHHARTAAELRTILAARTGDSVAT